MSIFFIPIHASYDEGAFLRFLSLMDEEILQLPLPCLNGDVYDANQFFARNFSH